MNNLFFNRYSSKIKRVEVQLPHFNFFHAPSSEEKNDSHFIGREKIIKQLGTWLDFRKNPKGSYLVTGYRGMGKSSFVGKVLEEITEEDKKQEEIVNWIKKKFQKNNKSEENPTDKKNSGKQQGEKGKKFGYLVYFLPFVVLVVYYFILIKIQIDLFFLLFFIATFTSFVLIYCSFKTKIKPLIIINLNLGGEVSGERDILSLIANSINEKIEYYHKYLYPDTVKQILKRTGVNLFIVSIAILLYHYIFPAIEEAYSKNQAANPNIFHDAALYTNHILYHIRLALGLLAPLLGILIAYILSNLVWEYVFIKICYRLLQYIGFKAQYPDPILQRIKHLNDRIDSSVSEDQAPTGQMDISVLGLSFKKQKTHVYQQASVREIEQELIQIIDDISSFARLIIVLDELDKVKLNITSQTGQDTLTDGATPDFGYTTGGFQGEVSSHTKKQNVLFLLTQLKYFISTAKAKFIFISGRELYDAFLADASDREFFVSSIFNGVINVNSFLTDDENSEKDITVMTERYLCKLLIDTDWLKEQKDKLKEEIEKDKKQEETEFTLKTYYKYLISKSDKKSDNFDKSSGRFTPQTRAEIEKTIMLLRYFITYLTYVSNGAPKKITTHIEKFIIKRSIDEKEDEREIDVTRDIKVDNSKNEDKDRYVLSFGYKEQQKIGFIHYIATPIFHTIINRASEYSDKLLVSSSFLISHIYKHHSNGFSWRNLEYIPELIEKHRTPELRDFIRSIISFLKQAHLSTITCGLYQMKFPKQISEEISIMSRRHEDILAIFNFSLDDSRSVRMYYSKLLTYYEKKGASSRHTQANIHVILGDLAMADEEYTEAIIEYRNAVSLLSVFDASKYPSNVSDAHASLHIILQVRAMLKLGLACEKRKTVDSALLTYNELINKLVAHRYIDETALRLKYKVESSPDWYGKKAILYKDNNPYFYGEQPIFYRKIHPQLIDETEKGQISYWIYGDEIIPKLSQQLTPEKAGIIARLSVFEDLRLAYLPSLAKLFAVEKMEMGGIALENIEVIESEFRYLHLATNFNDKYIISADFFRKLGDILYYKNSMLGFKKTTFDLLLQTWGYNVKADVVDYCVANSIPKKSAEKLLKVFDGHINIFNHFISTINSDELYSIITDPKIGGIEDTDKKIKKLIDNITERIKISWENGTGSKKTLECAERLENCFNNLQNIKKPCFACRYYSRSLMTLGSHVVKDFTTSENDSSNSLKSKNSSKSLQFLEAIEKNQLFTYEENTMSQIAFTLEAMGNVMVSCSGEMKEIDLINSKFIKGFQYILEETDTDFSKIEIKSQLEKSIIYFWTAAKYHGKASNLKESFHCYVKIIKIFVAFINNIEVDKEFLVKIFIKNGETQNNSEFFESLENIIVKRAIIRVFSNRDFSNMEDLQEIKWIFSREMYESVKLEHLSLMPDIEDLIYSFYEMKIALYSRIGFIGSLHPEIKEIYQSDLLNYRRKESTIYSRIHALKFKSILNRTIFNELVKKFDETFISNKGKNIYDVSEIAIFICDIINNTKKYDETIKKYFGENFAINDIKIRSKLSLLEFLVIDSMFCLMQILDIVGPVSKATLFTNSFVAEIYMKLQEWNKIYETIYVVYQIINSNEDELLKILLKDKKDKYESLSGFQKLIIENIQKKELSIGNNDSGDFFEDLLKTIGKHNIHYTSGSYFAEMAIKRYEKTKEMHTEGQAYKDFISNFYLLNDDLQNNTCQFSFALERYLINSGIVDTNIDDLKNGFKKSKLYKVENYFESDINEKIGFYAEKYSFGI